MNICFIGFGNIAQAIARGLVKQGSFTITAASPSLPIGSNKDQIKTFNDNKDAIRGADLIILAVKPAQMGTVLDEINTVLPAQSLLISVAAGLSLDWFAKRLSHPQALIRAMPNTPAAVGLAATPMYANKQTKLEQKKWAESIFSSIGITTWVDDERHMDSFTALSGSGPAYVLLFMEAMVKAACDLGLKEDIARAFTLQTLKGTLQLAEQSTEDLSQLRAKVTSPKGTTAAALQVLSGSMESLMAQAMNAAYERAKELGLNN